MKKRRLLSGILAGVICLLPFGNMSVQAEGYWPSGPEVSSRAAVVMDASTGTVLYEKNPHEQLYPASITKIMTTMLALENCSMEEEVTFSRESVYNIERDSTHIFRDVGEIMTMEQCLYAVMLGSANDCAYAVAEHAGKGYENFIAMMNDKAVQLGCENTHFANPHGLTDENHYTSAYDMALISRAALEDDTFRVITSTARYTIPFTNKHPDEETPLVNHHKMLTNYQGERQYLYEHCIGGKNGYTEQAMNTLVTFAEKDGMTLICVVLKAEGGQQYKDTRSLLDYCFDNFKLWNISENQLEYQITGTANAEIFGNAGSFTDLDKQDMIVLPKEADFSEASYTIVKTTDNQDVVALLEYTYAGRIVGSADIKVTNATVNHYPFKNQMDTEEKSYIEIKVKHIVIAVSGVILVALLVLAGIYLANNFYIIRHRLNYKRKQKSKFKTIKKGKHTKWRMRF